MVKTTGKTVSATIQWADGFASQLEYYAAWVRGRAGDARWEHRGDVEAIGFSVASAIETALECLAVSAYDLTPCNVCGTPAQWHEDNDHYPQEKGL